MDHRQWRALYRTRQDVLLVLEEDTLRHVARVGNTAAMWQVVMATLEKVAAQAAGATPEAAKAYQGRGVVTCRGEAMAPKGGRRW